MMIDWMVASVASMNPRIASQIACVTAWIAVHVASQNACTADHTAMMIDWMVASVASMNPRIASQIACVTARIAAHAASMNAWIAATMADRNALNCSNHPMIAFTMSGTIDPPTMV